MSTVTINILSTSVMQIQTNGTKSEISYKDWYNRASARMSLAREVADLSERYGREVESGEDEETRYRKRFEILEALARIGQETASNVFGSNWTHVSSLLQGRPDADIRIRSDGFVWIPWELLYHSETKDVSHHHFCGYGRNIYRIRPRFGPEPSLNISNAGFIACSRLPYVDYEDEILGRAGGSGIIYSKCPGLNPARRTDERAMLLDWLLTLNLVHVAGLMIPLRYLKESWVLVDNEFQLSIKDLEYPPYKRRVFSFEGSPLVVFNVRDNYIRDPRHILDYVRFLLERKAIGVIASEFPVPLGLAAEFTKYFYENLLDNTKSIGQALADTKSSLLEEGNPFAMFYAPYFEPSAAIVEEEEEVPMQCNRGKLCDLLDLRFTMEDDVRRLQLGLQVRYPKERAFQSYGSLPAGTKWSKISYMIEVLDSLDSVCEICEVAFYEVEGGENEALRKGLNAVCTERKW